MMVRNMFGTGRARGNLAVGAVILAVAGCARDVQLAGRDIPHATVGPVTVDGVTLDKDASPEAVAFAALRAIREDFKASTPKEREAALAKQFDLCAANVIEQHNRGSLERDEFIYNVVYLWTPTVSYYVDDFPSDQDEAQRRFVRRPVPQRDHSDPESEEMAIALEVKPPDGDARAQVILMIFLAKDSGFWRVVHLGFDQQRRSLSGGVRQASAGP